MKKLLIIFLLISSQVFSQGPWGPGGNPGGGNNGGPCNGPNPPSWCNNNGVPINNGISILLAGGLVLAIYKLNKSYKK